MSKDMKATVNASADYIADVATGCLTGFNRLALVSAVVAIGAMGVKALTNEKGGGDDTTEK